MPIVLRRETYGEIIHSHQLEPYLHDRSWEDLDSAGL